MEQWLVASKQFTKPATQLVHVEPKLSVDNVLKKTSQGKGSSHTDDSDKKRDVSGASKPVEGDTTPPVPVIYTTGGAIEAKGAGTGEIKEA